MSLGTAVSRTIFSRVALPLLLFLAGLALRLTTQKEGPKAGVAGVRPTSKALQTRLLVQGSLKDTVCPFETWLFPPKYRDATIYKAMFRCIMQGSMLYSLFFFWYLFLCELPKAAAPKQATFPPFRNGVVLQHIPRQEQFHFRVITAFVSMVTMVDMVARPMKCRKLEENSELRVQCPLRHPQADRPEDAREVGDVRKPRSERLWYLDYARIVCVPISAGCGI